jgi:hypothetical protein
MTPEGTADGPDVTALRALAEEATPGPWESMVSDSGLSYRCLDARVITEREGDLVANADYDGGAEGPHGAEGADAHYIAAANPAAILALLDRLAAVTAQRDQYAAAVDRIRRRHPRGDEESGYLAPGLWCPTCGHERKDNGYGGCPDRQALIIPGQPLRAALRADGGGGQ